MLVEKFEVEDLDSLDHKILEVLREDSRIPFTEIGQKLGVSDATVYLRTKKMREEGIIKKFTVEIDEKILEDNFYGFVFINVDPGSIEDVVQKMLENEKINEVYEVHGSYDLISKARTKNLEEMRNMILEIREIPNISTSELITIYKEWK
jgi:Lrp/AsnC family transcriptional regulator for asnA, asnC and gidA